MATTCTAVALWLGAAYAQAQAPRCDLNNGVGAGWGPGESDARNNATNATAQAIYDRVQTPGSTSSVTFNFTAFPGVLEEWTWRVNITNVRAGDLSGYWLGKSGSLQPIEDPHFVNVAWDLQWPESGEIQDALNRTFSESGAHTSPGPGQLCAASFDLTGLPFEISNRYKESDNGDCTGVFGEDCVTSMLNASAQWSTGPPSCGLPLRSFTDLPACQSIFNTTQHPGRTCGAYGGPPLGNITSSLEIEYPGRDFRPLSSGESFHFQNKRQTNGTNTTLLYNANQELQVMVLSGLPGSRQMLCQRVNKTDSPTSNSARTASATYINVLSGLGLVALVSLL